MASDSTVWDLECVTNAFSRSYTDDTDVYRRFATALDARNQMGDFVSAVVSHDHPIVLDVGAGPGIVNRRLWKEVRQMHCVEPSKRFRQEITAKSKAFDTHVYSSLEQFLETGTRVDVCFSSWADCDVRMLADNARDLLQPGGMMILALNFGGCEFSKLWPEEVRSYWIARLDALITLGYRLDARETQFEFQTTEECKRIMSYYFGPRKTKDVTAPIVNHNVAICWRRL